MNFKPTTRITVFALITFCLLQGCQNSTETAQPSPTSMQTETEQGAKPSDYLSITYTEYANGQGPEDGMVMRVYRYDIAAKSLSKISDLPYTSQYPLSVYSQYDNKLYYSADVDDKGDQLFSYNLADQTIEQLSDDIFAINHILPTTQDGPLLIVAVKKGRANLQLGFYNKNIKTFEYIEDEDEDTSTWVLTYSPELNKTYLAQFSEAENYENLYAANRTQTDMIPADRTIIEVDNATKKLQTITKIEKEKILGISTNGNTLFLVTSPKINKPPVEFSLVDIATGQRTMLDLPITTRTNAYLDKEEAGVYLLGGSKNPTENDKRGIYYYHFASQELEPIFLQEDGGFINNFVWIPGE